jgi:hypothetical protein
MSKKNIGKPYDTKHPEPVASVWTQDQLKYLAELAWKEMSHSPGFGSLSRQRQTEMVTQRLQEMVASDHYWKVACRLFPPTQPTAHDSPTMQRPANDSGAVPGAVPAPRGEYDGYDPKRLIGMKPSEIARELIKAGKVVDDTQQGRGLEIYQTSHRHAHEYEGS